MLKNYLFVMVLFLAGYYPAYRAVRRPLQKLMGPRYIAAYALTIGAGFFAPNIWLYYFVVTAAFVATVSDRQDALVRYVVMIALLPAVSSVVLVGSFYAGTFQGTTPLSIGMLIATAIKPNRGKVPPVRGWRAEDMAVLTIFLIFTVGATRFASFTSLLRQMLMGGTDYLLPYYLVRRNLRSPEDLRLLLGGVAISAASLAVIGIYEAKMSWPLFDAIQSRLSMVYGLSAFTIRRGNSLRAMASFNSPLILAYFLMLALVAWTCSRDLFRNQLVWKGGIALIGIAIVAPQSRGIFVALIPAMMVLLATRRRFAAAAGLLAASGIGGAVLFVLQHSSSAVAAFVGGKQEGKFYDYRGLLLHRGMQEGQKHPVLGQSMEKVIASLQDITQGDHIVDMVNSYLTMFLVSGLVGLGAFAIFTSISVRKLIARARRGDALAIIRSNRSFLLATMTGTLIYVYGTSFAERLPIYLVVLLACSRMTSTQLIRRQPKKPLVEVPEPVLLDERFQERLVPA